MGSVAAATPFFRRHQRQKRGDLDARGLQRRRGFGIGHLVDDNPNLGHPREALRRILCAGGEHVHEIVYPARGRLQLVAVDTIVLVVHQRATRLIEIQAECPQMGQRFLVCA